MKNYIIGFLIVCNLVLGSFIYRENKLNNQKRILSKFPLIKEKAIKKKSDTPQLNLFIFFSQKNCGDCLKVIEILNTLTEYFRIIGFVPENELKNEIKLRENTGATFELRPIKKYLIKFLPIYTPTIYGVGNNGNIYFVLPGVPNEKKYLKDFLDSFYYKAYKLLEEH